MNKANDLTSYLNNIYHKNYQEEEDFIQDLPTYETEKLKNLVDHLQQNGWNVNESKIFQNIVTHLSTREQNETSSLGKKKRAAEIDQVFQSVKKPASQPPSTPLSPLPSYSFQEIDMIIFNVYNNNNSQTAPSSNDLIFEAIKDKNITLFEKRINSKFENNKEFKLVVHDFKEMNLKIYKLTPQGKRKLDEMCRFLDSIRQKNDDFLKIFHLELKAFSETKIHLCMPRSLKDMVTSINFSKYMIKETTLAKLAAQCKNLQSLTMPFIHSNEQFKKLDKLVKTCTTEKNQTIPCPFFTSLRLTLRYDMNEVMEIKDFPLVANMITSLDLELCTIPDSILQFFGENLPNLKELNLSSCRQFTQKGMQALTEGCPQLSVSKLRKQI